MAEYDSKAVPPRAQNLIGNTYGRWTVLAYAQKESRRRGRVFWFCRCECGSERVVRGSLLKKGRSKSCGCYRDEHNATHGLSDSPEYKVWEAMKRRCYNPNDAGYKRYGQRGIEVCRPWRDSFETFFADMGPRPSKKYTLERLDNDGPYSADNCVWATRRRQANNTRRNVEVTFQGETMTMSQWARRIDINPETLRTRLMILGWPVGRALTEPTNR